MGIIQKLRNAKLLNINILQLPHKHTRTCAYEQALILTSEGNM